MNEGRWLYSYKKDAPDWRDMIGYVVAAVIVTLILAAFFAVSVHAGEVGYTDEQIVQAIFKAEGVWRAK